MVRQIGCSRRRIKCCTQVKIGVHRLGHEGRGGACQVGSRRVHRAADAGKLCRNPIRDDILYRRLGRGGGFFDDEVGHARLGRLTAGHLVEQDARGDGRLCRSSLGQCLGARGVVALCSSGSKPRHFAFGKAVQHRGIGRRRFSAEVAVLRGEIAEVFGNRLHGVERVLEAFQRAAESPIGHGQDLAFTGHDWTAFRLGCHKIVLWTVLLHGQTGVI